jgi:putative CocE/NonD family hydrolase
MATHKNGAKAGAVEPFGNRAIRRNPSCHTQNLSRLKPVAFTMKNDEKISRSRNEFFQGGRSGTLPVRLVLTTATRLLIGLLGLTGNPSRAAQIPATNPPVAVSRADNAIRSRYTKTVLHIPMRDGVKLFTIVYAPKDTSHAWPVLMFRTPYGIGSYEENSFPGHLGPNKMFSEEGFIFVYQDVRGRFMSEGEFEDVRPHLDHKTKPTDIDESTDTYDTIDYVLNQVPGHNGRVGMWGISYPGFYCSAGMINAHPALKAVSPQAPVGDWFFDDFHHHGAFMPGAFNFFSRHGRPRPVPTSQKEPSSDSGPPGGYKFFLELGSMKNIETRYLHGEVKFWTELTQHPNYDSFWAARNILPHLRQVAPAVLNVGGWFDASDFYGTLKTYQAIEKQNTGVTNLLVVGPWRHGGWASSDGERLGNISFGSRTAEFFRTNMELPFFNYHLKEQRDPKLPKAYVFETGRDQWRTFEQWPPGGLRQKSLYVHAQGNLTWEMPTNTANSQSLTAENADVFVSDPANPVPHTGHMATGQRPEYMTDDQSFAARRPDVLVYQTEPLGQEVTLAGPIVADLLVSTSAGDADWVVKVIDVYPPDTKELSATAPSQPLAGYQMMIRSEAIRGRFRENYAMPKPFPPNEPIEIHLPLLDVLHTFRIGHRIMVQIQSTWFPLIDRNPQKYVDNIFQANEADFIKATHRVYHNKENATRLRVGVLE